MSVLDPWLLGLGALGVAAVVALHLLARNEPERWRLPTARFVPESRERAPSRSLRLTDRALLALRALALAAIALAAAGPWWHGKRAPVRRVVVADFTRAGGPRAALADTVRKLVRPGDRLVVLDSVARALAPESLAALVPLAPPARAGRLGAALLVARQEARALARTADSVALVVASPLSRDLLDAATLEARSAWPGTLSLIAVRQPGDTAERVPPARVVLVGDAGDPLRASFALDGRLAVGGASNAARMVRITRAAALAPAESAWARAGGVLVHWPAEGRDAADSPGAVATLTHVAFGTMARVGVDTTGTVIARWRDGSAAAAERALGAGCVRAVGVGVPVRGDLALRAAFRAFAQELAVPCGGVVDRAPMPDSVRATLAGTGGLAPAAVLVDHAADAWLVRLLLAVAALALVAEWALRRRTEAA